MNQSEALDAMKQGQTVRGIDGLFLTHVEHGGKYLYRWNAADGYVERFEFGKWRKSNSFELNTKFEVVEEMPECP